MEKYLREKGIQEGSTVYTFEASASADPNRPVKSDYSKSKIWMIDDDECILDCGHIEISPKNILTVEEWEALPKD